MKPLTLEKLEKKMAIAEAHRTNAMGKLAFWHKKVQILREKIKEVKGE